MLKPGKQTRQSALHYQCVSDETDWGGETVRPDWLR